MQALLSRRTKKPISLTALIDVVFILLMFFMLSTTFDRTSALTLKQSQTTSTSKISELTPIIVLHSNGRFSKDGSGSQYLLDEIGVNALIDIQKAIVLIPMHDTKVQIIVTGLVQLKALGLSQVTLGESIADPTQKSVR